MLKTLLQNVVSGIPDLDKVKALEELERTHKQTCYVPLPYAHYFDLLVSCAEDFDSASCCKAKSDYMQRRRTSAHVMEPGELYYATSADGELFLDRLNRWECVVAMAEKNR